MEMRFKTQNKAIIEVDDLDIYELFGTEYDICPLTWNLDNFIKLKDYIKNYLPSKLEPKKDLIAQMYRRLEFLLKEGYDEVQVKYYEKDTH